MNPKRQKRRNLSSSGLSHCENVENNSNNEENSSVMTYSLSDILKTKWKVFRVSPLYNFNNKKLKRYEMKLKDELNAKRKFNSIIAYDCIFTINKKLRLNADCFEALEVKVISSKSRRIYLGYFISISKTLQNSPESINLPILLVNASGHEVHNIHCTLCKIFDCEIQPVTFTFHMLIKFFVKLLESFRKFNDDSQEELLFLEYRVPGCSIRDKLKVTLFLEDTTVVLALIVDELRENYQGIRDSDIILEFYNRLLNHIYNVYKIDLMFADLYKIIFPDVFITTDGQLKVSTEEAAIIVLEVLQHFIPIDAAI